MYFDEGKNIQDIATELKTIKQNIYGYIKRDPRYLKEAARRKEAKSSEIIKNSDEIIKLYYEEHKRVCEIAETVNLSDATVTNVIKKDKRYKDEKQKRKNESLKRNRELSKQIKARRRKEAKDAVIMSNLALLQTQNAISMSRSRKISNTGIVAANLGHYVYDSKKEKLVYDKRCGARPFDLPNSVGVHTYKYFTGKAYQESEV